jgi:peptidoglycan/LPS O-acetylase OafA/YrhL
MDSGLTRQDTRRTEEIHDRKPQHGMQQTAWQMNDAPVVQTQNNFDSLRLIFALLVIFSHSFPLLRGSNATEPLSRLSGGQITLGNISVWSFFVISGFLITQSWIRSPSPLRYLKKRIGRIYPGFAVAGLVSALIIVPIAATSTTFVPISLQNYLLNMLQLQPAAVPPVFAHNPSPDVLNGSLWSIPYEFWCYIGVMLLGMTAALRRRYFIVGFFALGLAFHLFLAVRHLEFRGGIIGRIFGFPPFWATVFPFFVAGMLFQLYGGRSLLHKRWLLGALSVTIISRFIPYGLIVTLPTCGAYLLMWLAYWPALHPLRLGRFGDFSYGTYLYAFPIQQLLIMHFGSSLRPWQLFAMAAPLTLATGVLSWFLVEKHFLQRQSELRHEGIVPLKSHATYEPRQGAELPEPGSTVLNETMHRPSKFVEAE